MYGHTSLQLEGVIICKTTASKFMREYLSEQLSQLLMSFLLSSQAGHQPNSKEKTSVSKGNLEHWSQ